MSDCTDHWGVRREGDVLLSESQAPHFDDVLGDLGDALLALVDSEVGPMYQLLVDLAGTVLANSQMPCGERRRTCSKAFV